MDMSDVWKIYDREILETPMPSNRFLLCLLHRKLRITSGEYQNMACAIQCRDCLKEGLGKFHILGTKDLPFSCCVMLGMKWNFPKVWSVRSVAATTPPGWRAHCWGEAEAGAPSSLPTWWSTPPTRRRRCLPPGPAPASATLASALTGKAADTTECHPTFDEPLQ